MAVSAPTKPAVLTMADLLDSLGGVSPDRVRLAPAPGTATYHDVHLIERRENRLFELVDGTLVEKVMRLRESILAVAVAAALRDFVMPRGLGIVAGADGMVRLFPNLVRIPDVAFISHDRIRQGTDLSDPVPRLVPDLAVEVLSKGNTKRERERKLAEYFDAGVRVVWLIDLDQRNASMHLSADEIEVVGEDGTLRGDPALPGFTLTVKALFSELNALDRREQ
jgi:Uma2 family endonuclease